MVNLNDSTVIKCSSFSNLKGREGGTRREPPGREGRGEERLLGEEREEGGREGVLGQGIKTIIILILPNDIHEFRLMQNRIDADLLHE